MTSHYFCSPCLRKKIKKNKKKTTTTAWISLVSLLSSLISETSGNFPPDLPIEPIKYTEKISLKNKAEIAYKTEEFVWKILLIEFAHLSDILDFNFII